MRKRKSDRELAEDIVNYLKDTPAGGPAANAQVLLQRAANASSEGPRQHYLELAQREIAKLDPGHYRPAIQRLQSQVLALQGRGGDSRIAHVTPGEIVIPARLQTPAFMAAFARFARAHGIDPAEFQVGNPRNRVNPQTGQPEFFDYNGQEIEEITVALPRVGPGGINDPMTTNPNYQSLGFNPDGVGQYWAALRHPWAASKAVSAADQAYKEMAAKFPNLKGSNDEADAYRHARWSQLMGQSVGPGLAKKFGDAHEISRPNANGEQLMDLYNNQIGRGLLGGPEQVEDAIKKGLLRKRPFDTSQ